MFNGYYDTTTILTEVKHYQLKQFKINENYSSPSDISFIII